MNANQNQWKNHHFIQALRHALDGIVTAFQEERNFRFHCCAAVGVVVCGFLFRVTYSEWLWLLAAVTLVIVSELWNTVTENLADLASHLQRDELAKKAKDVAAGAVLVAAAFAVLVAVLVFGPHALALVK
ncbi:MULTISPECIES: diacylglycerol kinase family protein [unclassified Ligilactobacillus]|uniref:diacylglycerol kinase family protein n=1 Tax=unclassified Ligilactobacillus TaxID=2767920 RepID=UPI003851FB68